MGALQSAHLDVARADAQIGNVVGDLVSIRSGEDVGVAA
jgi:hypothetical protein